MLVDHLGRKIEYLRISVTDRCNFKCIYCYTNQNWKWLPHEEILRFEEIEKIARVFAKLGGKRIRLTGGEPLLRRNIETLIEKLSQIPGIIDLSLTTNGFFLEELGEKLKKAGLKRINISLDTLNKEKFEKITGISAFEKVFKSIDLALDLGFDPVKINTVVIKGFNEDEILELAKLTLEKPIEVRFIEFMPIGKNSLWDEKHIITVGEIKAILERFSELIPDFSFGGGPAKIFKWKFAKGKIGLISPISEHFCHKCNRLRITTDGRLRPCLFSDNEINLKPILREGKGTLEEAFFLALKLKPAKHNLNFTLRPMRAIGG
ncbi:MAG: GTP 3',8-cyclase MoaA [Thermodesulfobacterium geofontis]|uniref:GTP 3',8-cyclase n=1 Tax=Thermodesulfobacterium geofontis TaxID=1295609 RepID=A0A2N7Q841_9BACT|nr:MAG: GTP 3',8-cyclase MoaA [Thermodesulfobacterium geofontis]PMP94328.1 MAG: GTP 3',8-cyclase MoaA [Thermodesulfobacterium geofontis]